MHYRLVSDEVYALLIAIRALAHDHVPDVEPAAAAYLDLSDEAPGRSLARPSGRVFT